MWGNRIRFGLMLVALVTLAGTAQSQTVTYTYDEVGELKGATSSTGPAAGYTYDAAMNRTQLTASSANAGPTAVNDSLAVTLNTSSTFDPRGNDTDPNGDTLAINSRTDGAHGTVAINTIASVTYTPAAGYTGADSFTYTISDGRGGTATGTVSVTVQ